MGSLLNVDQLEALIEDLEADLGLSSSRRRRKIISYQSSRWPLPIKWKFQGKQSRYATYVWVIWGK